MEEWTNGCPGESLDSKCRTSGERWPSEAVSCALPLAWAIVLLLYDYLVRCAELACFDSSSTWKYGSDRTSLFLPHTQDPPTGPPSRDMMAPIGVGWRKIKNTGERGGNIYCPFVSAQAAAWYHRGVGHIVQSRRFRYGTCLFPCCGTPAACCQMINVQVAAELSFNSMAFHFSVVFTPTLPLAS